MKTFKNIKANLDNECTILVFAQAEERNELLGENWVETDELITFRQLWIQAGVRFFGVL